MASKKYNYKRLQIYFNEENPQHMKVFNALEMHEKELVGMNKQGYIINLLYNDLILNKKIDTTLSIPNDIYKNENNTVNEDTINETLDFITNFNENL